MNREAQLLGMNQTHFTNPSGADNKIIKPYEPKNIRMKLAHIRQQMIWLF